MKRQNRQTKKSVAAITGGFGTGKSTAAAYFKALGAELIDADRIARKLTGPDSALYKRIALNFGTVKRESLAKIVFGNPKQLKRLNQLVHPAVIRIIREKIKKARKKNIVLDIPLLFEAKLERLADKIIVVKLSRQRQISRLLEKTKSARQDMLKRINSQMPLAKKIRLADFIIDNNGSKQKTKKQVKEIWRSLWKN